MTVLRAAYVKVKPDTEGFDADLKTRLRRIDASKEGKRVGRTFSDGLAKGSFVAGIGAQINNQLRGLNLPELNLKANATDALASIKATREHLQSLVRNAPTIAMRVDAAKTLADIDRVNRQIGTDGERVGRTFGDGVSKGFGGTFIRVAATMAAKMTIVGSAAAAAAPGVIQLTAALAPAGGALVALPAAMAAVTAGAATFKVATAGVGDAIKAGLTGTAKQADKALQNLAPAAAGFARSIIALKPSIQSLRASVAQRFFQPLQDEVTATANIYFPLLRRSMSDLAGPLGGLGEQFAQTARKAEVVRAVKDTFLGTQLAVVKLRGAIDPLTTAFAVLIQSTAPELPGIAAGITRMAQGVATFITNAVDSGRVLEVFENAKTTLRDLGGIAVNVGSILHSVFAAATAGGGSLLANFRALTGQVAAFLKSGAGSAGLTSAFQALGALGQSLRTGLGAVLPAIAQAVRAIAPAIVGLAPAFAQLVVALAPLIPLAAGLAAQLVVRLTPAIAALAGWLTRNQDVLKGFAVAVGATVLAVKAYEIFTKAAAIATAVWSGAQTVAAAATKVLAAGQWLLNAALTANPIGIVIVAVAALVAAIIIAYKHSATFRAIVQGAWQGIQVAVSVAWNTVIKPAVTALVAYFRDVIAPTALWLWRNIISPAFTGISFAVKAAWVIIQIVFKAWQLYLVNVLFPVIRFLWNNVVKPVFAGMAANISFTWNNIIKPVFSALGSFIKNVVAPAFNVGVTAIRKAWEGVRDAAKGPVTFVVNRVINPLIGGINSVAGFVGVKDRIPKIGGFARGGQIPGTPSMRDNLLAAGPNGLLKVASGEFITNTRSTLANLPLVKAINAKKGKVRREDVDPYLDGFAHGGRVGDGIGDFFGNLIKSAKGVGSAILHPKDALIKVANAALDRIPGSGAMRDVVKGMGSSTIARIASYIDRKLGAGGIGGAGVFGGWRGMQNLISGRFPGLNLISGFRPGATTLTGNRSYHALGRAVDYPPVRALAAWIRATFGAKTKELITPWQDLNLHNGKPHTYTGAVWNQHNFAGGNAHVHWAAARGGLVGRRSGIPIFDTGGTLMPGYNTVYNGTGRSEPLVPAGAGEVHFHFHGPVASKQAAKTLVLEAYNDLVHERKIRR